MKQYEIIISKKEAPLRAQALILLDILLDRLAFLVHSHQKDRLLLIFGNIIGNIILYPSMGIAIRNFCINFFFKVCSKALLQMSRSVIVDML